MNDVRWNEDDADPFDDLEAAAKATRDNEAQWQQCLAELAACAWADILALDSWGLWRD